MTIMISAFLYFIGSKSADDQLRLEIHIQHNEINISETIPKKEMWYGNISNLDLSTRNNYINIK